MPASQRDRFLGDACRVVPWQGPKSNRRYDIS
jgi:hypothetical protein